MYEFGVKEEGFSLKWIEKVPQPKKGECFLLYQEGAGVKESMVISHGGKYSATAVRHKHYNKKVIFQLQRKNFTQRYHVHMKNVDFYFYADINISYELQDVQEYFQGNLMEDDTLRYITRKCADRQKGKWEAKQEWKLQRELEDDIEQNLKQFKGVKFWVTVKVWMDESALAMQKSDKETVVEIHTSNNRKMVQIKANEHREEIIESEKKLKELQIKDLKMQIKNFGALAPVANEYLAGRIDGKEFFNYIMKYRMDELNLWNVAATSDLLTDDESLKKIYDILTFSLIGKTGEQQLPGENGEGSKTLDMGRKDSEENAYADGDIMS